MRDGRLVKAMEEMTDSLKLDLLIGKKESAYLDSFCACWSRHVSKAARVAFCLPTLDHATRH